MRRYFGGMTLLLALALSVGAADKDRSNSKYIPTQDDIDALIKAKEVIGKVSKLESTGKGFTLIYEYEYLDPNQKGINTAAKNLNRQQQQILRQYNQIMKTKNPTQRAMKLQQLMLRIQSMPIQDVSKLFKTKKGRKDFDLVAIEDVKVRVKKLPVRYDEKGNVQEYTAKEKKELKGKDPNLPGYTAEWDNVSNGQTVKVYLKAKKKKPAKDKDGKDKDKAKDDKAKDDKADAKDDKAKAKDKEEDDDDRPQVRMILILENPDADKGPDGKKNP
jgi:hypothetical protein